MHWELLWIRDGPYYASARAAGAAPTWSWVSMDCGIWIRAHSEMNISGASIDIFYNFEKRQRSRARGLRRTRAGESAAAPFPSSEGPVGRYRGKAPGATTRMHLSGRLFCGLIASSTKISKDSAAVCQFIPSSARWTLALYVGSLSLRPPDSRERLKELAPPCSANLGQSEAP